MDLESDRTEHELMQLLHFLLQATISTFCRVTPPLEDTGDTSGLQALPATWMDTAATQIPQGLPVEDEERPPAVPELEFTCDALFTYGC
ncbi:Hypothetical predicted protein [Scomber scombrus]|uniref:Uncharacterized protein n=1 Tax=Scomber scombrus TaxID=13677 RepID=A0AAV1P9X8_SCOSC